MTTHSNLNQTWRALRVTYGLVAFLAGLDKFFNLLTDWPAYLAPAVSGLLPLSEAALMRSVGVVEMLVGILILTRWTRTGAYLAAAWLISIAVNLAMTGSHFDVAVRDVALAVGAWTLGRLTDARQPAETAIISRSAVHSAGAEA